MPRDFGLFGEGPHLARVRTKDNSLADRRHTNANWPPINGTFHLNGMPSFVTAHAVERITTVPDPAPHLFPLLLLRGLPTVAIAYWDTRISKCPHSPTTMMGVDVVVLAGPPKD